MVKYLSSTSPEDSLSDRTMCLLCATPIDGISNFPPSLISANYGLLHMETDDPLPLTFSTFFLISLHNLMNGYSDAYSTCMCILSLQVCMIVNFYTVLK